MLTRGRLTVSLMLRHCLGCGTGSARIQVHKIAIRGDDLHAIVETSATAGNLIGGPPQVKPSRNVADYREMSQARGRKMRFEPTKDRSALLKRAALDVRTYMHHGRDAPATN